MIQPHDRHMSFSLYISVLAVADTVSLSVGKFLHTALFPNKFLRTIIINN